MKDCKKIRAKLHDYALGRLDGSRYEKIILEHLKSCEECNKLYQAEALYCKGIDGLSNAMADLEKRDLASNVVAQIASEKQNPVTLPKKRLHLFSYGTAAALVLVCVLLFAAYRNGALQKAYNDTGADLNSVQTDALQNEQPVNDSGDEDLPAENRVFLTAGMTEQPQDEAALEQEEGQDVNQSSNIMLYSIRNTGSSDAAPESDEEAAPEVNEFPPVMALPPDSCDTASALGVGCESSIEVYDYVPNAVNDTVEDKAENVLTVAPKGATAPCSAVDEVAQDYTDFLAANALTLTAPQFVLNNPQDAQKLSQAVVLDEPLVDSGTAKLYAVNLTADQLRERLTGSGITDFTLILPQQNSIPTGDVVYIYIG